ncbi:phospholipase D family protein [Aliarcobacter lanthieri]|uniref:Phospholipase D family protein n=1 Tax=Aliarcobacter butzleri TaxID=28197 RepID=A0AAW7PUW2_9BACT|nr:MULTISPECIES: phospholipase D family protein [Aliarcobacter]MDN5064814.1 phospholipase D family protein [Aliarcobacter butzleri]MDN5066725.1 phospholipase D family protein [Aliarcobacter butzleri]
MTLLTTPNEIETTICNLIKTYKSISFASAWASTSSKAFPLLLKHANKINKIVVGIHFYQTHPNFIKEFIDDKKVKFKMNPNGIFHPKIYLFQNNENDWECLIGSANFTKAAMQDNSEIIIKINSNDTDAQEIYTKIVHEIKNYFETANSFTNEDYQAYLKIWNKKSKKLLDIQDEFSSETNLKPIFKSKIIMLDWNSFFKKVKNDKKKSFKIRLELLDKTQEYFRNSSFANMTDMERRQISGITSKDTNNPELDWMYFGNMVSPRFKTRIRKDYIYISKALDYIPLNGIVSKNDYMNCIEYFKKKVGYGYGVITISRLLAMKRPDVFFCITGGNKKYLYEDFGLAKDIKSHEYERYWDEIIQRIHMSEWYDSKEPRDDIEKDLWNKRAAMLDTIFYNA